MTRRPVSALDAGFAEPARRLDKDNIGFKSLRKARRVMHLRLPGAQAAEWTVSPSSNCTSRKRRKAL